MLQKVFRSNGGSYAMPEAAAEARRVELVGRVQDWIDRHLGEPDLSPAVLAAAHHVSVRQLHRVFEAEGRSVAAEVRARRLERCRAELLATDTPIHTIAARWGFPRPADFSRAFRAQFGTTASEYRRRAGGAAHAAPLPRVVHVWRRTVTG